MNLLEESLGLIAAGGSETVPNELNPANYNSFPTPAQGLEFRKRGLRAI